jgi:hypothetical protein
VAPALLAGTYAAGSDLVRYVVEEHYQHLDRPPLGLAALLIGRRLNVDYGAQQEQQPLLRYARWLELELAEKTSPRPADLGDGLLTRLDPGTANEKPQKAAFSRFAQPTPAVVQTWRGRPV